MSDFMSYGGKGPFVLGLAWTWTVIGTIIVIVRGLTASKAQKDGRNNGLFGIRWDYAWCLLGYLLGLIATILLTVSILHGAGNHITAIQPQDMVSANYYNWIAQEFSIIAVITNRVSLIAFLLMILGPTYRWLAYFLIFSGTLSAITCFIQMGIIMHQCTPSAKLWDQSIPGTCNLVDLCTKTGYLQGSTAAFVDFALAFSAFFVIARLFQMNLKTKIGLCIAFAGGLVAGAAAIVKTYEIGTIADASDITYDQWPLLTWAWTEVWFVMIFGSLPALRQFVSGAYNKTKSNYYGISEKALNSSPKGSKGSKFSHGSSDHGGSISTMASKNKDWLEMGGLVPTDNFDFHTAIGRKGESGATSEENILPPPGDIVRTRNVEVESESDVGGVV